MIRSLRNGIAALTAAVLMVFGAQAAVAQGWAVTVDVPVSFQFNDSDGGDVSADSVTGYRVGLITPWYIGVGMASATAVENVATPDLQDLNYKFNFTDLLLSFNVSRLIVTLGYGTGKVVFDPETSGFPAIAELTLKEADATQTILGLGLALGESWDVHVGYHSISAPDVEVTTTFFGTPSTTKADLGATMVTAGVGLHF